MLTKFVILLVELVTDHSEAVLEMIESGPCKVSCVVATFKAKFPLSLERDRIVCYRKKNLIISGES